MARPKNPHYQRGPRRLIWIPMNDKEFQTLRLLAAEWQLPSPGHVLAQMMHEFIDYLRRSGESRVLQAQDEPRPREVARVANR